MNLDLWNPVRNDLGNVFPFSATQTFNKNTTKPNLLTLQDPTGTKGKLGGVNTPNGFQAWPTPQCLQSWNLTVEREIGKAMGLEVAYVAARRSTPSTTPTSTCRTRTRTPRPAARLRRAAACGCSSSG